MFDNGILICDIYFKINNDFSNFLTNFYDFYGQFLTFKIKNIILNVTKYVPISLKV